ncbi:unnamed protein product [Cercopithifilaria johnstoni]|uniref:Uncharacterized protein n=1 Tax=Cercopithifilaria johnstoni TaxID=2874296 RepID=A0A8J2LRJ3_9BILA|nr:unnamed protein product [Cercopithifilaria johnstoni]
MKEQTGQRTSTTYENEMELLAKKAHLDILLSDDDSRPFVKDQRSLYKLTDACLEASGLRNPPCFETVQPLPLPHRAEISIQIRVSWKVLCDKRRNTKKNTSYRSENVELE